MLTLVLLLRGLARFIAEHGCVERDMTGLWIRDEMAPPDLRRLARSEKDTRVARR